MMNAVNSTRLRVPKLVWITVVVAYITVDGGKGPSFQITGTKGHLSILSDATHAHLYRENTYQRLSIPTNEDPWPTGPAMVRDLVQAIKTGGRTACDINQARRATEIGFAIHHSSKQGGAKIAFVRCGSIYTSGIIPLGK